GAAAAPAAAAGDGGAARGTGAERTARRPGMVLRARLGAAAGRVLRARDRTVAGALVPDARVAGAGWRGGFPAAVPAAEPGAVRSAGPGDRHAAPGRGGAGRGGMGPVGEYASERGGIGRPAT